MATDRLKAHTYAAAGIPEYWIVNLPERSVEVYRQPRDDGAYGEIATLRAGQVIRASVGADVAVGIAVDDILP
ncbi:MAG: Uma2 family endonuclease [Polyangiaceae bacterium]|nr:Uma2 family endonuclease [Polyangiaceae bacterium]MCE7890886.1 Uma2 family endonuclease [Sorangiineae bacterium PRO1]MCL4751371.1 Uma2 family endonuclease [Myxococcales bacterium]